MAASTQTGVFQHSALIRPPNRCFSTTTPAFAVPPYLDGAQDVLPICNIAEHRKAAVQKVCTHWCQLAVLQQEKHLAGGTAEWQANCAGCRGQQGATWTDAVPVVVKLVARPGQGAKGIEGQHRLLVHTTQVLHCARQVIKGLAKWPLRVGPSILLPKTHVRTRRSAPSLPLP